MRLSVHSCRLRTIYNGNIIHTFAIRDVGCLLSSSSATQLCSAWLGAGPWATTPDLELLVLLQALEGFAQTGLALAKGPACNFDRQHWPRQSCCWPSARPNPQRFSSTLLFPALLTLPAHATTSRRNKHVCSLCQRGRTGASTT